MNNCDCAEQPCRPVDECCIGSKSCENQPGATEVVMGHEKARVVEISQLDYGYRVCVGCQTFAIESLQTVLDMLGNYLKNPGSMEKMWRAGELKFYSNMP